MLISQGELQKNLMGSTIYLVYVNDLFSLFSMGSVILYANDVTRFACGEYTEASATSLQNLSNIVAKWSINMSSPEHVKMHA